MQDEKKIYEIIEHTADIGIRVRAETLPAIFINAAVAMFDIMAEKLLTSNSQLPARKEINIRLKAGSPEELFINWLNELLSLSSVKEIIFDSFKIDEIDNNSIKAEAQGSAMKNYRVNTEIKAATHHALKLKKTKSGWLAEVIFDV